MDRNQQLLLHLYEHYLIMKTYHFQTGLSFRHTKTDEYLQKYLMNMDKLMEVIQGIDGTVSAKTINIAVNTRNDTDIDEELKDMLSILEAERKHRSSAVNAIIDLLQGDLHQLIYLFEFQ